MFAIETQKDIKLISRSLRERWGVDRKKVVAALMEVVNNRDPDLMLGAAELLLKADAIDYKREELEGKRIENECEQRLRLLELARSIPVDELARIASQNGISVEVVAKTRTRDRSAAESSATGGGT